MRSPPMAADRRPDYRSGSPTAQDFRDRVGSSGQSYRTGTAPGPRSAASDRDMRSYDERRGPDRRRPGEKIEPQPAHTADQYRDEKVARSAVAIYSSTALY